MVVVCRQILQTSSYYSILAHGGMNTEELVQKFRDWNLPHRDDSSPVLGRLYYILQISIYNEMHCCQIWQLVLFVFFQVMTDSALHDMPVSDAAAVIHYEMPSSSTEFADRLWCLRRFFTTVKSPQHVRF